jgi:hypothetical protein
VDLGAHPNGVRAEALRDTCMTYPLNLWIRHSLAVLGLSLVLAASAPSTALAQVVRGRVLDSILVEPLDGVTVELLSTERVVARAVTDDSGHFAIRVPASGSYRFRAKRIGYRDKLSIALPIDAARDATITLQISSLPVALEAISISASSQIYLQNTGFYERRLSDPGYFILPDQVISAASKSTQTADVLDGIPGVTLLSGGGSRGVRVPQFTARSGTGCDNGPRIYLDGHLMNQGSDPFDVNTIQPADLLAIEIYRHVAQVPLKFGGTDANCGVIVMWTKH